MATGSRVGGRSVVLTVIALAIIGCLGTIWRYSDLHVSTENATVEIINGTPLVVARFSGAPPIATGQKATLSTRSGPAAKASGVVGETFPDGRVIIVPASALSLPAGTALKVTVETPQP